MKSTAGRWEPAGETWVIDETSSPCIDAGDPNSPVASEPFPDGAIINMGTYGGTAQASLSSISQPPGLSGRASNPSPADGAVYSGVDVILSWISGLNAVSHDVYFGTDIDIVANADTTDALGTYRGRQAITTYTPPEGVGWRTELYCWRIDEVDSEGSKTTGDVWTFVTGSLPPY